MAAINMRYNANTYGVEIHKGEHDVLILASTVVIDMVCHGDDKRA